MQHDVAKLLFGRIAQAQQARLMSLEHFSVDGTPLRLRNDPYGAADHLREWAKYALIGAQFTGADSTGLPSWLEDDRAARSLAAYVTAMTITASVIAVAYLVLG